MELLIFIIPVVAVLAIRAVIKYKGVRYEKQSGYLDSFHRKIVLKSGNNVRRSGEGWY